MPILEANWGAKPRNPKRKPWFPYRGWWVAKIDGKPVKLCRWTVTDHDEIEKVYNDHKLIAQSRANQTQYISTTDKALLTVRDGVNLYMDQRARDVESKDETSRLSPVTYAGYDRALRWVVKRIGGTRIAELSPQTFTDVSRAAREQYGVKQTAHIIATTRMVFRFLAENGYTDREPKYGTNFTAPSFKAARAERHGKNQKLFTAAQIRTLLNGANDRQKAMILLGLNCGYLTSDLAELPISFGDHQEFRLNLKGDIPYIRFDRVKTGERRMATLWPETVKALKVVIGDREEGLIFETRGSFPLVHQHKSYDANGHLMRVVNCDSTVKPFRELCEKVGIKRKKEERDAGVKDAKAGIGFSAFRSTLNTVAYSNPNMSVANVAAIAWVMGHKLAGEGIAAMANTYHKDIPLENLKVVTDYVRWWLYEADEEKAKAEEAKAGVKGDTKKGKGKKGPTVTADAGDQNRAGTPDIAAGRRVVARF